MTEQNQPEPFPIWPHPEPESAGHPQPEQTTPLMWENRIVRNVCVPTLVPHVPETPNGTAVIVCPGGVFQFLMIDTEGNDVARWLAAQGITAFVLKYRLAPTPPDDDAFRSQFESSNFDIRRLTSHIRNACRDGRQAVESVRRQSKNFSLREDRIGIVGFSAGAAVAVNSAIGADPVRRPNFVGAVYGAPPEMGEVPENAPPLFMAYTENDELAGPTCRVLRDAWKRSGRPLEVHAYAEGGHGFGIVKQGLPSDEWTEHFIAWLRQTGFLPAR
jgi:acetyl esterase/lipase